MTAVIFWLVLFGSGSGTSQAIVPVPYQTEEACKIAGQKYYDTLNGFYGANFVCISQPRSDVERWTEAHADREGGY